MMKPPKTDPRDNQTHLLIFAGRLLAATWVSSRMIGRTQVISDKLDAKLFIEYWFTVPPEVEHTLIWTKIPIYHPNLVDESVKARIDQDGLWGFTGNDTPPPSPSHLHSCLPALAEWGITKDKMIKSDPPTEQEALAIEKAGKEVHRFVKNRWRESEWETAWFVNPPVSRSLFVSVAERID